MSLRGSENQITWFFRVRFPSYLLTAHPSYLPTPIHSNIWYMVILLIWSIFCWSHLGPYIRYLLYCDFCFFLWTQHLRVIFEEGLTCPRSRGKGRPRRSACTDCWWASGWPGSSPALAVCWPGPGWSIIKLKFPKIMLGGLIELF